MNFDVFHPFTTLKKNRWQNAVICCMLQAGLPSLHYYCAVMLHSCIVPSPVGHSSNHQYHCYQLTIQSSCVLNFLSPFLRFSFYSPSYVVSRYYNRTQVWEHVYVLKVIPINLVHSLIMYWHMAEGDCHLIDSPESLLILYLYRSEGSHGMFWAGVISFL